MTNKITSKTSTFCQKLRLTKKHINKKQSYRYCKRVIYVSNKMK